jgi:hypothetical protein
VESQTRLKILVIFLSVSEFDFGVEGSLGAKAATSKFFWDDFGLNEMFFSL